MSLHKLDEEHGAGARPGHLACAEIKLSRRGSATQCWLISAQLCTLVYSVRIKYEAAAAFTSHRDDVVVRADVLVGEARALEPIIAKVMRAMRRVRDHSRSTVGQHVVEE